MKKKLAVLVFAGVCLGSQSIHSMNYLRSGLGTAGRFGSNVLHYTGAPVRWVGGKVAQAWNSLPKPLKDAFYSVILYGVISIPIMIAIGNYINNNPAGYRHPGSAFMRLSYFQKHANILNLIKQWIWNSGLSSREMVNILTRGSLLFHRQLYI